MFNEDPAKADVQSIELGHKLPQVSFVWVLQSLRQFPCFNCRIVILPLASSATLLYDPSGTFTANEVDAKRSDDGSYTCTYSCPYTQPYTYAYSCAYTCTCTRRVHF